MTRSRFEQLVEVTRRRHAELPDVMEAFALRFRDREVTFGGEQAAVTLVVNDDQGLAALRTFDISKVGEAYLDGRLDVEGDLSRLLALRGMFSDFHPLQFAGRFVGAWVRGQIRSDHRFISHHYEADPAFYLSFLDERHRAYSQGIFERDDESLEEAITHKLDYAFAAAELRPGDRVLDIGGGWGAFVEYGGQRGLRVTSLTISEASRRFVDDIIATQQLPCDVRREHFFAHNPEHRYDAIVNLGVTEHLPNYARTLKHYQKLLKPGGRVYLDASAARRKHRVSTFLERQVFPGNGSPLCLGDYVTALSRTPFELEAVHNDRVNYGLTTRHWAENLDANRGMIEERWGSAQYRRFRIYLWGCVDGFRRDLIQAYRLVLRNP